METTLSRRLSALEKKVSALTLSEIAAAKGVTLRFSAAVGRRSAGA